MRIFLEESVPGGGMRQPLLKEGGEPCVEQCEDDSSCRTTGATGTFKKLPSVGDLICLLKSRYVRLDDSIKNFLCQKCIKSKLHLVPTS